MLRGKTCRVALAVLIASASGCQKSDGGGDDDTQPQTQPAPNASACAEDRAAECDTVAKTIADLETQRQAALDAKDAPSVSRITIKLNREKERLDLLTRGETDPAVFAALDAKYDQLGKLVEAYIDAHATTGDGGSRGDDSHGGTREPTTLPISPLAYHPKELEAVMAVEKDFGPLFVPIGSEQTVQEYKVDQPWAGYWYPYHTGEMFDGDESPLAKIDAVAAGRGLAASSVSVEKERFDTTPYARWEGLCGAWAAAAIMFKEPSHDVELDGVTFSVADQKALITKSLEAFPMKFYGLRYMADADSDGTIQDIRPEAFHRVALTKLAKEHRAFIVDDDPSIEVWNKPIYRIRWTFKKDPRTPNAVLVTASPWMIQERASPSSDLTNPTDDRVVLTPPWKYRLYYDPATVKNGEAKVIAGEWLETSRDVHPDRIMLPEDGADWLSLNDGFNQELGIVKEIVDLGQ
jgi:hypothetical protein